MCECADEKKMCGYADWGGNVWMPFLFFSFAHLKSAHPHINHLHICTLSYNFIQNQLTPEHGY